MKRLTKSKDQWVEGVIGGIARYFDINPDILRIGFILGILILNLYFLIPLYIVMIFVMPGASGENSNQIGYNKSKAFQLIGVLLIIGGIYSLLRTTVFNAGSFLNHYYSVFYYNFHRFLRIFAPVREVIVAVFLIAIGFIFIKKKNSSKEENGVKKSSSNEEQQ